MCKRNRRSGVTSQWVLFHPASGAACKIDIAHWWPGRKFALDKKGNERSPFTSKEVNRALKNGNPYMTVAQCVTPHGVVRKIARCLPPTECRKMEVSVDVPTKRFGRDHSLGMLQQEVAPMGYDVVEVIDGEPDFFMDDD